VLLSRFAGRSDRRVIFSVPSVCRSDTLPALVRVIDSVLRHAPRNLADFTVEVVVDEVADGGPDPRGRGKALLELQERYAGTGEVQIVVVPRSFRTPNGTLFKARANQYALELRRGAGRNGADTYVYHLDDDTHVGADTVASIAEFIHLHHGRYYLAQGVLTFPFELTPSRACRLLDSIRPIDDLTRFRFFTGMLGRPLLGLHGEHLLVRADVEDAIGWDFGPVLVEDAYFALRFSVLHPRRSTVLRSFSYGASPESVADLVRQRRRWAAGLLGLCLDRSFPAGTRLILAYAVGSWILGPFQSALPLYLVALALGTYNTSPFSYPELLERGAPDPLGLAVQVRRARPVGPELDPALPQLALDLVGENSPPRSVGRGDAAGLCPADRGRQEDVCAGDPDRHGAAGATRAAGSALGKAARHLPAAGGAGDRTGGSSRAPR
jgi:hypothetical protein